MRGRSCLIVVLLAGCTTSSTSDHALQAERSYLQQGLEDLRAAAVELQNAAPAPDADGWNAHADRPAVNAMKTAWQKMRAAYERIEGPVAGLFPDIDVSIDERYDGFVATAPDDDAFDGEGVTGMHAVERILWSDAIPARVTTFEQALPNYRAPAFPANADQAAAFKQELCGRIISDTDTMLALFPGQPLDPDVAYRGVIDSLHEQLEKTTNMATGEDETRYAQHTLADMRSNLAGALATYQAFQPALLEQPGGAAVDAEIQAGFQRVSDRFTALPGDELPEVPATWSSQQPSAADLATPYGQLFQLLQVETDLAHRGSLVEAMSRGADLLAIPQAP